MNGVSEQELLDSLLGDWRTHGPTLAIVEGFSGTGKTTAVRKLKQAWQGASVLVTAADQGGGVEDLLFDIAANLEMAGDKTLADEADGDYRQGLKKFLKDPSLVIIDDFDEVLNAANRSVSPDMTDFLSEVGGWQLPGRLLLVSNQTPAESNWLTQSKIVTLAPPETSEAERLLKYMLRQRGLEQEIPADRIGDVIAWLGRNPRAMQAFVACLRYDPLEELIGMDEETWELRDQPHSAKFLMRLEEHFLRKTINRLDGESLAVLEGLSVYRKPFLVDALNAVAPNGSAASHAREDLSSRFLLTHAGKLYSLNPIAKRLSYARINRDLRRHRAAHSKAADHFQKRISNTGTRGIYRSGSDFVEARYHLIQSGRDDDFENIAGDYRRLLVQNYKYVSSVPDDPVQAGQLLEVLKFALNDEDKGYAKLRKVLVALLMQRGMTGDEIQAFRQIAIVCRESNDPGSWLIRARLTAKLESPQAISAVGRQALGRLSQHDATLVCSQCALDLAKREARTLAINLLEEALAVLGPDRRVVLYTHLGFILAWGRRRREAAQVLLDGFEEVRGIAKEDWRLFERAVFMCFQSRDIPGIRSAQLKVSSEDNPEQYYLCEVLLLQLRGSFSAAAQLGSLHGQFPALAAQTAFCWLACGNVNAAYEFAERTSLNAAGSWLRGLVAICRGARSDYLRHIEECLGRTLTPSETDDQLLWLRIWDRIPEEMAAYPAFYFPILPTCLTQLEHELYRVLNDYSVFESADLRVLRLPQKIRAEPGARSHEGYKPQASVKEEIPGRIIVQVTNYQSIGDSAMGPKYEFHAPVNAGAVGDHTKVTAPNIQQQATWPGGLNQGLATELARILELDQDNPSDIEERAEVEKALAAARDDDEEGVHGHLRAAGRWALEKASAIGAEIAKEAILRSMGSS